MSIAYPTLNKFDNFLEDCIQISIKEAMVLGETSWFHILEFLQSFADKYNKLTK